MRTHASLLRLASFLSTAALLSTAACVSKSAGVDLAAREVRERTGMMLPENEDDGDDVTKGLLAKPLTADSAARIALWNNGELRAALDDVGVARAALVSALALPNPKAGIGVNFHDGTEPDLDLDLTIDVVDLFLIPLRDAGASAALEAAAFEAASAALDTAFETKVAFYEHEAAAQKLELEKTILYAAAQSADFAKQLQDAGNVAALEALTERALYEEARVAVAEAEADVVAAREALNAAMGLFGTRGASWKSEGKLPEPTSFDDTKLESRAVANSVDLRALERRYSSAESRVDLAWAEGLLPEVGAGVGAERDHGDWGVGPRVEVEVPLFYQGQGAVDAAEAEASGAKHRHEATATRIRAAARTARTRLLTTKERAAFYKDTLVPLRDKIVEETLLQVNAMNASPLQLLTAKRDQIATATGRVEALRDHWMARAEAEALLAGRSPGPVRPMRSSRPALLVPRRDAGH